MDKVVGMIPVLLGSTRIPDKNIIIVNSRILCSYTIEACRKSGVFSDIYLNSENDIFSQVAKNENIQFYQRKPENGGTACRQKSKSRDCKGSRCVINEHYLYDFMKHIDCDYLLQVNSTSPLLKSKSIASFVNKLVHGNYDCLFAVNQIKAESFYQKMPINFNRKRKQPSQELKPIDIVCWAIAGWKCKTFITVYERDNVKEYAPVFAGNLGLFPVDEREALDIDEWSTLDLVENYMKQREHKAPKEWTYLDGRKITESK